MDIKEVSKDTDGMMTYDFIVNNIPESISDMDFLVDNLIKKDQSGKYLASSAKFLAGLDKALYSRWINIMIEAAIQKDRERRYLGALLESVWGADYKEKAEIIKQEDDNFRRIYKRIYEK